MNEQIWNIIQILFADIILSGAGDDTISDSAAADVVTGGAGADSIDASTGTDDIRYASKTDGAAATKVTGQDVLSLPFKK